MCKMHRNVIIHFQSTRGGYYRPSFGLGGGGGQADGGGGRLSCGETSWRWRSGARCFAETRCELTGLVSERTLRPPHKFQSACGQSYRVAVVTTSTSAGINVKKLFNCVTKCTEYTDPQDQTCFSFPFNYLLVCLSYFHI